MGLKFVSLAALVIYNLLYH